MYAGDGQHFACAAHLIFITTLTNIFVLCFSLGFKRLGGLSMLTQLEFEGFNIKMLFRKRQCL